MKPPTLHTRTYWVAVKAAHLARITNHPGARIEALAAMRNHVRHNSCDPRVIETQLTTLEKRHGPHQRTDAMRIALWPDRRTVDRYRRSYELTGTLPDFTILDTKG